jgi:UDP-perosamine 4-acetyltransferase
MNNESVIIIGAGGHAKVVIEMIRTEGKYQIAGCTARSGSGFILDNVVILGTDDVLSGPLLKGARKAFIAIGDNYLRLRLLAKVSEMGFELINAVSPNAVVSPSATLDRGVAIMAGAVINASAHIGNGCNYQHECERGP